VGKPLLTREDIRRAKKEKQRALKQPKEEVEYRRNDGSDSDDVYDDGYDDVYDDNYDSGYKSRQHYEDSSRFDDGDQLDNEDGYLEEREDQEKKSKSFFKRHKKPRSRFESNERLRRYNRFLTKGIIITAVLIVIVIGVAFFI